MHSTKHVPGPLRSNTSGTGGLAINGPTVMCQTAAMRDSAAVKGVVRSVWCTRRARGITTNV